jgi:hypothetical protein
MGARREQPIGRVILDNVADSNVQSCRGLHVPDMLVWQPRSRCRVSGRSSVHPVKTSKIACHDGFGLVSAHHVRLLFAAERH